jgi:hypothetical protein
MMRESGALSASAVFQILASSSPLNTRLHEAVTYLLGLFSDVVAVLRRHLMISHYFVSHEFNILESAKTRPSESGWVRRPNLSRSGDYHSGYVSTSDKKNNSTTASTIPDRTHFDGVSMSLFGPLTFEPKIARDYRIGSTTGFRN